MTPSPRPRDDTGRHNSRLLVRAANVHKDPQQGLGIALIWRPSVSSQSSGLRCVVRVVREGLVFFARWRGAGSVGVGPVGLPAPG